MNDIIVDAEFNRYRSNERESAKNHINKITSRKNSIILFDRGYPSKDLFQCLISNNLLFLMRLPSSFKSLIFEEPDKVIEFQQKYSKESILLRCVHVKLPDGTIEYLVTNIMEKNLTELELKELYFLRWGIESKYRGLKNRFQIEAFSGLKAISIKQDFYAAMFVSNLVSIAKCEADNLVSERTSSKNNFKYQSNRSFLINRIKSQIVRMLIMQNTLTGIRHLLFFLLW